MRAFLPAAALYASLAGFAPAASAQEVLERWLFLGRRTASAWQPPSVSLAAPQYPVKAGNRLSVRRHALVYDAIDCRIADLADVKPAEGPPPSVELLRAGRDDVEIVGAAIECPSVCGAKTVWAKVRFPAARLIVVEP